MQTFRLYLSTDPAPLTRNAVRDIAGEVLAPRHFFTGPEVALEGEHAEARETSWEVFRGRLLGPSQTRQTHTFETWDVYLVDETGRSGEPLLSLKLDWEGGQLHVVRGLLCYVWEGYDAGGNVILSRETTRWARELAGTVRLDRLSGAGELRDELVCQVFHAVVGASRLPLTSVEAPLPAFSLGRLAYFHGAAGPMRSWRELLVGTRGAGLGRLERAKHLETLLHATPHAEVRDLAARLAEDDGPGPLGVLRTVFNEASLSPWTDLVDRALALVDALEKRGHATAAGAADFLAGLVRQVARHLTAYDLVTFHHRGANYPDALLLDAALKACLRRAGQPPGLFLDELSDPEKVKEGKRLRRRALRQGWLLRRFYEGHPVPDAPTSPGEAARVLPPPHVRVPEEQILNPSKRPRRLFDGDPLAAHLGPRAAEVLARSVEDLHHPAELLELGTALFLDRPLGAGKAPGEPDQTVLLSHLAFSRSLAARRLEYLGEGLGLVGPAGLEALRKGLADLPVTGMAVSAVGGLPRPGAVSAADARQVAADFVFLRTTAPSARDFFRQYDFDPLFSRFPMDDLAGGAPVLILTVGDRLVIHDAAGRPRVELTLETGGGYETRAAGEYLAGGLRVVCVREGAGVPLAPRQDGLPDPPLVVGPRLA